MDFSTLNLDVLHSLPSWECPGGKWSVARNAGAGCYGDPPGYPSYFLRAVYRNGNTSNRDSDPVYVIEDDAGVYRLVLRVRDTGKSQWHDVLRRLWNPLALNHERSRLWIRHSYRRLRHCYRDDAGSATDPADKGKMIFPVPFYKLRSFVDDPRFSDAWRTAEQATIAAYNEDVIARATKVARPENHCAVRAIQEFYPDYQPELELIESPDDHLMGYWWETEAHRPSVADCKPRNGIGAQNHAEQWCQWCGRKPGQE